jgi:hypothetical protein
MIVLILVALGEAADPSTQALTSAAEEGLGSDAIVVVREAPAETLETHSASEQTAELLHADAVATVAWSDATHTRAHVSVFSEQDHAWQDRSVAFAASDASIDRGHQLGFGIAAMVPPLTAKRSETASAPAPTPALPLPNAPARADARIALDLVGSAASGTAGGFGGELSGRWRIWKTLWVRGGVGTRFGDVSDAQASFFDVRFDGGPALTLLSLPPLEIGARADFVVTRIALARDQSSSNSTGGRTVPGADLILEIAYALGRNVAIVAGAGAEIDFGSTSIVVDGNTVARATPLRTLGEIGVRVRF